MLASTVEITKGNEAVPISKVEGHISDICSHYWMAFRVVTKAYLV